MEDLKLREVIKKEMKELGLLQPDTIQHKDMPDFCFVCGHPRSQEKRDILTNALIGYIIKKITK